MQLFVAFFLGFCFLIFCTFPFAVITRLKLVLLRLLVLVFLSCNIIYLFHFGCIACALCRHHHIVVIIMETLGFVNLATAAVRGFLAMTHLALNCNKKKLLNWPSNKQRGGSYEKLLGLISCCCCCTWHCLWLVAHTTSGLATALFGSLCCLAISVY